MRTLGVFATALFMLVMISGTVLLLRSIPEIRRYLNIRNM